MKLTGAFLRLVRWPNLVFIALTQFLFYYCIILPSFEAQQITGILSWSLFGWFCLSSVFIAAAGYIINDYFDLNIDQVNKPDTIIIQKIIRRRWAIFWHLGLSFAGVLISFYVSWKIRSLVIAPANLFCVLLLWFYSTTFKKKLLIGNLIISLLTAWVVFVLYLSELNILLMARQPVYHAVMIKIFKLTVLYAGFAFIISLVREVVKDMEDIQGDEKYGCKTMPIVWGIPSSKVFAAVWMVVLILGIIIMQFYAVLIGWFGEAVFALLLILVPAVKILRGLYNANAVSDFHKLSSLIKMVMLTGILSMIFFKWHF
jgi:4-hydroxybenzoate polyprenyltransferase